MQGGRQLSKKAELWGKKELVTGLTSHKLYKGFCVEGCHRTIAELLRSHDGGGISSRSAKL